MKNNEEDQKEGSPDFSAANNKKGIYNQKMAATHFEAAAKNHRDAAKHREAGDHKSAVASTITAHGHFNLGSEAQREAVKYHIS